ncbi:sugar phosphate isomerase/epimerase [Paenibacillus sp. MMS20-IR301]|uniref:sugar phosphate isomerase/epimerase family protein n=1 Tax=Paenibacillus sp. MMS20-IR301 TaxID=2895946 RepID=UPI0028E3244C|nr:sugar phosphate isomerase/epimerase [Paenibacillus sp. MMS20-IR301]WNS43995.1 sugar phosphate isomerase/epimerase [Paenibacillus sp. MMS20-IR301]
MRLGIIAQVSEESFSEARRRGLSFLEFTVNEGDDVEAFCSQLEQIAEWSANYNVAVGSIGRWKSLRIDEQGEIIQEELERCYKLIDAASRLNCRSFVAGCNYVDELSLYANCTAAIAFFSELLAYAKTRNVQVSTYNCRKVNFVNTPDIWSIIHGHLPELGIKYDPSHARFFGGDYLQEALDWGHRFTHVHLKGSLLVNGKKVDEPPAGMDQTDWRSFIAVLRATGYDAGLSIEPRKSALPDELADKGIDYSAEYFRKLLLEL